MREGELLYLCSAYPFGGRMISGLACRLGRRFCLRQRSPPETRAPAGVHNYNAPFIAILRCAQDDRKCFYIFAHIQLCCNMIGLLRKHCFEYTETVGADIIRPLCAGQFSESHIIIGALKRRPMNGRHFAI